MARRRRQTDTHPILTDDQEVQPTTIEEGSQEEALESQEVLATIVEGTEEEVFGAQDQKAVELLVDQDQGIQGDAETEPSEQAVPVESQAVTSPPPRSARINRRPYIEMVEKMLSREGGCSRKEIVDAVLAGFPSVTKGAISTFLTDSKNPKYSYFKERPVIANPDTGNLIFADCFGAPQVEESDNETTGTETEATEVQAVE